MKVKVRKTSHQEQIGKQNSNLVAKEGAIPKEVRRMTMQVIAQVY
jgi:hypothetical protein